MLDYVIVKDTKFTGIRQGSLLLSKVNGNCVTLLRDLMHKKCPYYSWKKPLCKLRQRPIVSVQMIVLLLHTRIFILRLEPFCRLAASVLRLAQQTWIVMRMCADSWVGQDGLFHDWLNWGVHCTICSSLHHAAKHLGQPHDSCYHLPLPSASFLVQS